MRNTVAVLGVALSLVSARMRGEDTAVVKMEVDASARGAAISPWIYGVNAELKGPYARATQARMGGNRWTAYNWVTNASNAGSDWHFQNDDYMVSGPAFAKLKGVPGGALVPGLEAAKAHGAWMVVTAPMAGWVSGDARADGDVRYPGGDTSKPMDP